MPNINMFYAHKNAESVNVKAEGTFSMQFVVAVAGV
jgi:hypothetical protein